MRFPCMINLCLHNENSKYYHRDENDNNKNNDDSVFAKCTAPATVVAQ